MAHSQQELAARLAALHESGCFLLPNVWDFASAALSLAEGYEVIATTSAGVAFAQGYPDGEAIGRDAMLAVAGGLAARFAAPVTADLEAGYGAKLDDVALTVRGAIAVGLVGCNIEDGNPTGPELFDGEYAAARIAAGVAAATAANLPDFSINARTDPYLRRIGTQEQCFDEAVRRGRLYLAAGARSVFVPGVVDRSTIERLVREIGGPVNIMAVGGGVTPAIADLEALGVRRVSLGGAWMAATYGAARETLRTIGSTGRFDFSPGIPFPEFNRLIRES